MLWRKSNEIAREKLHAVIPNVTVSASYGSSCDYGKVVFVSVKTPQWTQEMEFKVSEIVATRLSLSEMILAEVTEGR